MIVTELFETLQQQGVDLWIEGDRLRFRAPKGALAPDLRTALSENKGSLLQHIRDLARRERSTYPLSHSQQSLYFMHRAAPDSAAYNVGFSVRVRSVVDLPALRQSFQALVDRHAALRTTYHLTADGPVQTVHGFQDLCMEVVDASGWSEETLRAEVESACHAPYDLENGPVLRVHLFSRDTSDHVLLLALHHIAADGWALYILLDELRALYAAHLSGKSAALPRPPVEYTHLVHVQREMLEAETGRELRTYWEQQLSADILPLDLPTDRPRPAVMRQRGATSAFTIDREIADGLKALAREQGTTLFTVLLTAYQVLLSRHSGRPDIVVGSPVFGRGRSEFQAVVGHFVNMVVMRADLSEDPSFRQLVATGRQTVLDALAHEEYPFALLVQRLGQTRDASRSPVFQAIFALQKPQRSSDIATLSLRQGDGAPVDFGGLLLEPYPIDQQEGQVDLTFEAAEVEGELRANFKYSTDLFDRSTIERMQGHLQTLLRSIVANPDTRASRLDLLPAAERATLLVDWNRTEAPFDPEGTIQACFAAQAARTPDAPAVTCRGETWTYRQLDSRAGCIAARLRAAGVRRNNIVAICMERSNELLAGLLGILKAGGGYLPLDAAHPPDRLAFMLEDARPVLVVTDRHTTERMTALGAKVVNVDSDSSGGGLSLVETSGGNDLAYVIYTSGSTGTPKGVMLEHRNVMHLFRALDELYGTEPGVSIAAASISFDASVVELFWPIVRGYHVVIWPRMADTAGPSEQGDLAGLIRAYNGTFMLWPPSIVRVALAGDRGIEALASVRILNIGGETLTTGLLDQLGHVPTRRIINMYGPTEITVAATAWVVEPGYGRIPIGKPLANSQLYVLDPAGQPVPIGVTGELFIGGAGVGRGYLNRPALTEERFLPNPFGAPGERMYRSGDLVRYLPDGNLEFVGRADGQVKIRGFRVELGEIEQALTSQPGVREAAVIAHTIADGDTRLVAFVRPADSGMPDAAALRRSLRERLPDYMIPAAILQVDDLPQTASGKLDRKALAASASDALQKLGTETRGARPRRTLLEDTLAAIWADVLGLKTVDVDDDFFEIGGHSLLAARLMQQLSDIFWMTLPVRLLFDAPTVARMAEIIEQRLAAKQAEEPATDVLEINTGGSRARFFFLHAALQGDGFYCFNLARHLGDDQPLYALAPLGLDGSETPATIEAIAAKQLETIRRIQPHGPYHIGGFCASGPVAYELARMLTAAGERVEVVVVIDSYIHESDRVGRVTDLLAGTVARTLGLSDVHRVRLFRGLRPWVRRSAILARLPVSHVGPLLKRVGKGVWERMAAIPKWRRDGMAKPVAPAQPAAPFQAVLSRYLHAVDGFVARTYDGPLVYLRAEASPFDATPAWRMVASNIDVRVVRGDHNTCITTQIESLAAHIREVLQTTQAVAAAGAGDTCSTVLEGAGPVPRAFAKTGAVALTSGSWMVSILAVAECLVSAL